MTEFVRLLYRQLQATLPPTRAYSIQELRRLGLPDALVHYLQHQAIARAETMLPALDDTWFETEAPDVREAYQQLRNRLRSHVRIPASVWPELLGESLQALAGYLVQPIRTLTAHVFAEADSVPADEALRRMHWFQPYAYFREAVALYVEEKQVAHLERERFESLGAPAAPTLRAGGPAAGTACRVACLAADCVLHGKTAAGSGAAPSGRGHRLAHGRGA